MSSIFSTETSDIESTVLKPTNGLLEAAALGVSPTAYGLDFNSFAESSAIAPSLHDLTLNKLDMESGSFVCSDSLLSDFLESDTEFYITAVQVDDLTGTDNGEVAYSQTSGETASTSRISGSLDYSDDLNPLRWDTFKDDYTFSSESTDTVQLNLDSSSFDAYLQLIDLSTGDLIVYDDDGGIDTNSQLTFTAQAGQQYAVRVTSFGSYETGSYDLTAYFGNNQPNPPNNPPNEFSSIYGYGLIDAAAAVAAAVGQSPFSEVADIGGNQWNNDMINAPEVWNRGYTGEGVVVAVIDSGVDIFHEDLRNNIWENTGEIFGDGIDNDGNGYIDDRFGWNFGIGQNNYDILPGTSDPGQDHGTHVAGTIAAANNGFGMTGVAYGADIMAIRMGNIQTGQDGGRFVNTGDLAQAIRYAVDNGADVINMSLGWSDPIGEVRDALAYAAERNVIAVSSSGNKGDSVPGVPARYATDYGISVGAVSREGTIPDFSSQAGTDSRMHHVMAPGVDIYSTTVNNDWSFKDGTSMAAPHVAGVVALMLSANRNLTHAQVREILTSTTFSTSAISQTEQTYDIQEATSWTMSAALPETIRWGSFNHAGDRAPLVSLADPIHNESALLLSDTSSAKVVSDFLIEQSMRLSDSTTTGGWDTDGWQQELVKPLLEDDLLVGAIA